MRHTCEFPEKGVDPNACHACAIQTLVSYRAENERLRAALRRAQALCTMAPQGSLLNRVYVEVSAALSGEAP